MTDRKTKKSLDEANMAVNHAMYRLDALRFEMERMAKGGAAVAGTGQAARRVCHGGEHGGKALAGGFLPPQA